MFQPTRLNYSETEHKTVTFCWTSFFRRSVKSRDAPVPVPVPDWVTGYQSDWISFTSKYINSFYQSKVVQHFYHK